MLGLLPVIRAPKRCKRVVADIAADQLKQARLKRRQRLEEINHPQNAAFGTYRPPLVWRSFLIEALTGLFLCAELDQAVLTVAFHKLRTDPVETPGNLPAIMVSL